MVKFSLQHVEHDIEFLTANRNEKSFVVFQGYVSVQPPRHHDMAHQQPEFFGSEIFFGHVILNEAAPNKFSDIEHDHTSVHPLLHNCPLPQKPQDFQP